MGSVLNAKGVPLHYSGTSVSWFSATTSAPQLYGSPNNDSMWADASIEVTLIGGKGDDIYYLYSSKNDAFEQPGQGVDTISTWMSLRLPSDVENLNVTGDMRFAFGNKLDNLVSGGPGSQTLDGLNGNDVLNGGAGADTFVVTAGRGSDLIRDFAAEDSVRIDGYGFTSFDQVRAHMVQQGDNVRLNLSGSEFLVFAGKTVDQFDESQFKLGLDRSALRPTFADNFDTLSLWNGSKGTWDTNFWWGTQNGSTLGGELQWYVDRDYGPTKSVNPFDVHNGLLTITAERAPADVQPLIDDHEYTSGMLTTYNSFAQTYGYFEMRADLPEDQGTWPGFWLLPADGSWPPELDVIERIGQDPSKLVLTAHSNATGEHTLVRSTPHVASTGGFHTYGVLWTEDSLVWYYDNTEVARAETPADMHQPMYMLANLAIGGIAGPPADDLATPAEMKIDYIRAYSVDDLVV